MYIFSYISYFLSLIVQAFWIFQFRVQSFKTLSKYGRIAVANEGKDWSLLPNMVRVTGLNFYFVIIIIIETKSDYVVEADFRLAILLSQLQNPQITGVYHQHRTY